MLARLWVHRLIVALLAAGYGVLLPAHHHGVGHAPNAEHRDCHSAPIELAEAHGDHHDHGDPDDHHRPGDAPVHEGEGHPSDCGICHAVRTLYTPVAAPLPALAPQAVTAVIPVDADDVVSIPPRPAYQGRAPPASL